MMAACKEVHAWHVSIVLQLPYSTVSGIWFGLVSLFRQRKLLATGYYSEHPETNITTKRDKDKKEREWYNQVDQVDQVGQHIVE